LYIFKYSLLILCFYIVSCTSSQDDRTEIIDYLALNNIEALDTLGVFIHISQEGSEEKPSTQSTIELSYTGRYLDGEIFDRTEGSTTTKLNLTSAISGLKSGLLFFGKNGNGSIYIPSDQGYGANPPFGVRKNAILVYDIDIKDF
jgi:FKBP-type peptidyl-prolyl cis-trans isomerase FkpA